jgi:hypothetical protein
MGVFGNGVAISTPWCRDETGSLLWRATQGCAARHTQASRIASHDPLWSYINVLSSREPFPWMSFPILSEDPYLKPRNFPLLRLEFG